MATTFTKIDVSPIKGKLQSLLPLSFTVVSQTEYEFLWDQLVRKYHYLGCKKLLGHRLKYLVFAQERPVAALSWSAPALKVRARDHFIGWSEEQRKKHFNQLVNNSRFLILPWVKVRHLASYILSRTIRQLTADWRDRFGQKLLLLETYVDSCRFQGTSYKAANWIHIGRTSGYGKQGKSYVYHGREKEVFLYVLNTKFRKIIDCQQKPSALFHRAPLTPEEAEKVRMILRHADWHPDIAPCMDLNQRDIQMMAEELESFHKEFHSCFKRPEQQRLGITYLSGLLSNSQSKSIEPMALELLGQGSVRSLQRFMKTYRWDQEAMEAKHQSMLAPCISSLEGMINVDSSEFLKKGKESIGVARQYCGTAGKVENCQSGVFVGYSSDQGYGLLSAQLYMPKSWFSDEQEQRRQDNLVPENLTFLTKPQIALQLINKITQTGLFPAKWIGCDATFGSDSEFLKSLPKEMYYFANIRSNTNVFLEKPKVGIPPYKGTGIRPKRIHVVPGQPQVQRVVEISQSKNLKWTPVILDEGAKGPILAEVTRLRIYPSKKGLPENDRLWLFLRRTSDGQIKYALSNAPEHISLSEMCKASTMRWPIEQCFKDGKDQLGMDQYEHRSWPAWRRHMIYVFLAMHFLLRLRIKYKKNSSVDIISGAQNNRNNITSLFSSSSRGS